MPSRLLICGFGAFPNVPANPSALAVERLRDLGWSPRDTVTEYAVLPTSWDGAVAAVNARLRESRAQAVLLTGVAGQARVFQVETLALNRASTTAADADGLCRPEGVIAAAGAAKLPATAPVDALLGAIRAEGLPAQASTDAGDYLCNFTFYSLLYASQEARLVAFLHMPPTLEDSAGEAPGGRCFGLDDLTAAIRASGQAMADALAKPPASGFNAAGQSEEI